MKRSVDYLNFDILITRFGDQYHVFVVDAPGGDADAPLVLPFTPGEIDALPLTGRTRRTRGRRKAAAPAGPSSGPLALTEIGSQLYDAVFHDDVRSVLVASQQEAATADKALRIRLRFNDDTAALATLPWEILFDPLHKQYLVLSEARPIVRYLALPRPKPPLVIQPPLRILAVLANARDHVPLDIEGEWQAVTTALAGLVADGKVVLERLESPTRRGLQERLMGDPVHVLHFVGHGAFDTGRGQGLLAMENAAGDADLVEAEALGLLLQNHSSLRLIYLNACEGATGGLSNVFAGVAQTLVRHGIPAALAMQDEISDDAAISMARTFYTAMAAGLPVDAALTQARVALASGGSDEWVLPVLFSRSPDNRLFDLVAVLPTPACPYPGMRPFSEGQAGLFFGRDKEIDEAANRLLHHPFLAVVGPSGSGKSSLVFGGILPALRRRDSAGAGQGSWQILTMRPGDSRSADGKAQPREALAHLVGCDAGQLAACTFALKTLVVVDQFEELFTLAERSEATAFIDTLAALAGTPNLYLLLTVRADFYPEMMAMGPLWEAVKANRLELTPLGEDGLWAAIVEPAAKVGVTVDEALAVALIGDAAGERGALPLVQMTLVLLWDRVTKRELKLAAYRQMADGERNGLQVAIDLWADNVYNNQLAAATRPIARRIFLRLIQFGQGRADTRRQQTVAELQSASDDPPQFAAALDILAASRLLTLSGSSQGETAPGGAAGNQDGDEAAKGPERGPENGAARQVDIAHETLIGGWGLLRGWIQELRNAETLRRRLDDKAAEWVRLGRGEGGLLDEYELYETEEWLGIAAANGLGSSPDLLLLARASRQSIDGRRRAEETARQRELDSARMLAEEAHNRAQAQSTAAKRMRWLVASLGLLLLLALAAGSWIRLQSDQLADRNAALTAQTEQAQYEQRRARAGELAALAQLTMGRTEPDMALALGQAVAGVTTTLQADGYVLSSASAALTQAVEDAPPWLRTVRTLGTLDPVWARKWAREGPPVTPVFDRSAGPTAAFSPDGRAIVGVTGEGESQDNAYVWDAATGSLLTTLAGHTARVYSAVYDPSGARIVTASADGTARIWDPRRGTQLAVLAVPPGPVTADGANEVISATFSPRGDAVVTTHGDGSVRIWDAARGSVRQVLRGHSYAALSAAWSPDGRRLVTSGVDRTVRLWDAASGEALRTFGGHEAIVRTAAFDPSGTRIVTASEDGTARVWDAAGGRVLLLLTGHQAPVYAAVYSLDGRYILTAGADRTARLWDAANGLPVQDFAGHTARVTTAGFSPDGTAVVTASADRTIRLWHCPDHPDLRVLRGHIGSIYAVAYSPRGDRIVSAGGADKTARIWDAARGKELRRLEGHSAGLIAAIFSPDGQQVATTGWDNTIRIWDARAGAGGGAQVAELDGHTNLVRSLAFSPAGDRLVSASSDGTVRIWDMVGGTQRVIWSDPAVAMHAAVYSPGGDQIAFGGAGGQIRLWDTAAQTVTAVLEGHSDVVRSLAYAPDGRRLVSASTDGTARVWALPAQGAAGGSAGGAAQLVLDHHTGAVYTASFSPDGARIVTGGRDGTVRLWDAATGAELLSFAAHRQPVFGAAFSPDGSQVASVGDDGVVRLWPAGIARFLSIAAELRQVGPRGDKQGE